MRTEQVVTTRRRFKGESDALYYDGSEYITQYMSEHFRSATPRIMTEDDYRTLVEAFRLAMSAAYTRGFVAARERVIAQPES